MLRLSIHPSDEGLSFPVALRIRHQNADAPHPFALLCARRERPRGRRAAEQRDELAAFQLIELHSIPASQGRVAGYRIGSDQSAGIEMILQPILVLPVLAGDRPATRSAR
jgi:hypothetical protein